LQLARRPATAAALKPEAARNTVDHLPTLVAAFRDYASRAPRRPARRQNRESRAAGEMPARCRAQGFDRMVLGDPEARAAIHPLGSSRILCRQGNGATGAGRSRKDRLE
jgi:hypothetical protein